MTKIPVYGLSIFLFSIFSSIAAAQQTTAGSPISTINGSQGYAVKVAVTGLGANDVVQLTNNGKDTLNLTADGQYKFPALLQNGAAYSVLAQTSYSPDISCAASKSAGIIAGAGVLVQVSCSQSSQQAAARQANNASSGQGSGGSVGLDAASGNASPDMPSADGDNAPALSLPGTAPQAQAAGASSAPTLDDSGNMANTGGGDLALPGQYTAPGGSGAAGAGQDSKKSPQGQQAQQQSQSQQTPAIALKAGEPSSYTFYRGIEISTIDFTLSGGVTRVTKSPKTTDGLTLITDSKQPELWAKLQGTPLRDTNGLTITFVAYNKDNVPSKLLKIHIKVAAPPMMGDPGTDPMPISVRVNTPACTGGGPNDSFTQLPGQTDLFIGRDFEAKYPNNPRCYSTLSMFNMSFTTAHGNQPSLTMLYELLPDFATLRDGYKPNGNFDPYVAMINGTYWVAWQCAQWNEPSGLPLDNTGVCLGPLIKSGTKYQIDLSRSALVATHGSDPKILYWQGQIYLYWTDIKADQNHVYELLWEDGTKMAFHGSMLCPSGTSGCRINGEGASGVYKTMIPGGGSTTNITADVFATMPSPAGDAIYVIAGIGGNEVVNSTQPYGCAYPHSPPYEGCYEAQISKTTNPLGPNSLNQTIFPGKFSTVPVNESPFGQVPLWEASQEYTRFAKNPHGHIFLYGFLSGRLRGLPLPENKFFSFQESK